MSDYLILFLAGCFAVLCIFFLIGCIFGDSFSINEFDEYDE